jgi:glycine cleavage system T protein
MTSLALATEQAQLGAVWTTHGEWQIPAYYSNPTQEYQAIRQQAGLIDLSFRGRLKVAGKNGVQFLQGLVSNDVKALNIGQGIFAAFLNVTGRVLSDCYIYKWADYLLVDLPANTREKISQSLQRFVPAGDFEVTDLTTSTSLLSLQGPQAALVLSQISQTPLEQLQNLAALQFITSNIANQEVTIIAQPQLAASGYLLLVANSAASAILAAILAAKVLPVGWEAYNLLRLEAGLPLYGVDFDDTTIILEAGLENAVSYNKGCYLGQETVAKIHYRGHNQTARRLAGLVIDSANDPPPPQTKVQNAQGKEIGYLTSTGYSPALNKPIALAYLRREQFTPGQVHNLMTTPPLTATVVALPFFSNEKLA